MESHPVPPLIRPQPYGQQRQVDTKKPNALLSNLRDDVGIVPYAEERPRKKDKNVYRFLPGDR